MNRSAANLSPQLSISARSWARCRGDSVLRNTSRRRRPFIHKLGKGIGHRDIRPAKRGRTNKRGFGAMVREVIFCTGDRVGDGRGHSIPDCRRSAVTAADFASDPSKDTWRRMAHVYPSIHAHPEMFNFHLRRSCWWLGPSVDGFEFLASRARLTWYCD